MILPTVSKEDADKMFPGYRVENVPSGKQYIRITSQPKWSELPWNQLTVLIKPLCGLSSLF